MHSITLGSRCRIQVRIWVRYGLPNSWEILASLSLHIQATEALSLPFSDSHPKEQLSNAVYAHLWKHGREFTELWEQDRACTTSGTYGFVDAYRKYFVGCEVHWGVCASFLFPKQMGPIELFLTLHKWMRSLILSKWHLNALQVAKELLTDIWLPAGRYEVASASEKVHLRQWRYTQREGGRGRENWFKRTCSNYYHGGVLLARPLCFGVFTI